MIDVDTGHPCRTGFVPETLTPAPRLLRSWLRCFWWTWSMRQGRNVKKVETMTLEHEVWSWMLQLNPGGWMETAQHSSRSFQVKLQSNLFFNSFVLDCFFFSFQLWSRLRWMEAVIKAGDTKSSWTGHQDLTEDNRSHNNINNNHDPVVNQRNSSSERLC